MNLNQKKAKVLLRVLCIKSFDYLSVNRLRRHISFMMRRNSYLGLREVEQNLIMTEACGATNHKMMEVGGATSSKMKVCGATVR